MKIRSTAAMLVAGVSLGSVLTAQAATVVPGAPMVTYYTEPFAGIDPAYMPLTCSQGPNGTVTLPDGKTAQVMLTAGHCVKPIDETEPAFRDSIEVPAQKGTVTIGTVDRAKAPMEELRDDAPVAEVLDQSFNSPDYGTVRLGEEATPSGAAASIDQFGRATSPVAMTSIKDYPDVPAGQVRFDNFGQPICFKGQTSGEGCGVQILRVTNGVWSVLYYRNGDSGGVNYDPITGEVIGVSSQSVGPIARAMPADRALQEAYDIPDGQVNQHFTVTPSQEGMDPMTSYVKRSWEVTKEQTAAAALEGRR